MSACLSVKEIHATTVELRHELQDTINTQHTMVNNLEIS